MTIRQLFEADREQVMPFLLKQSSLNLFIIGDIYNFGFVQDFQQVWGDFDEVGNVRAVLLRYHQYYLAYAEGEFNVEGFAQTIQERNDMMILSGGNKVVERFQTCRDLSLDWSSTRTFHFAELIEAGELVEENTSLYTLHQITLDDTPQIISLYDQIDEFEIVSNEEERIHQSLQSGATRGYAVKTAEGELIAMARTTSENPHSAMIIGVATHPNYRKQGLASLVMSKLCAEILAEGKKLCLFYDNPEAGKIYQRIGFKEIGLWTVVKAK